MRIGNAAYILGIARLRAGGGWLRSTHADGSAVVAIGFVDEGDVGPAGGGTSDDGEVMHRDQGRSSRAT